jgi:hypothetical protein
VTETRRNVQGYLDGLTFSPRPSPPQP